MNKRLHFRKKKVHDFTFSNRLKTADASTLSKGHKKTTAKTEMKIQEFL